jgi:OOP family OmpA-OmpF porin
MVNMLYDFNNLSPTFKPYLGVGAGYQWTDVNSSSPKITTGSAGAFAYQAIVGAAIPISSMPGLAVTGEYRFMGLAGDRTYDDNGHPVVRTDDFNHSILIGLRYAFGAPPPPLPVALAPVAVPAPALARSYLVFFDWDKATLTTRAQRSSRRRRITRRRSSTPGST